MRVLRSAAADDRADLPAGAHPVLTRTDDGVSLSGLVLPGPSGAPAFVIGHGFTNHTATVPVRRMIAGFAAHGTVIALDFRGHGGSAGRTSVGRDETLDLDAAVRLARAAGHPSVAVVGFSMGGAVALRQAAIGAERPDAVVSVSAPSRWYLRTTGPMRRVHWLLEHPAGPVVARMLGTRLGEPWATVPPTPLELVGAIPPRPLLLVHGTADHYFGPDEAQALHRASGGGGPLWLIPGMGHAESGTSAELIDRIAGWVVAELAPAARREESSGCAS